MELYVITGAIAVLLGIIYWFCIRDDGSWDQNAKVQLAKIDYGVRAASEPSLKREKKEGLPMRIIFYSQTGTGEDFSKRLMEEAETYGFAPEVTDAEEYAGMTDNFANEMVVVFVVATYGEGDPPDNAAEFHEWLMSAHRESDLNLKQPGVKYAVFGLGNHTYDKYNEMGKVLDARMEALGAERVFQLGLGDDDQNIENDFLIWKKGFSRAICKACGLPPPEKRSNIVVKRKQRMLEHRSDEAIVKKVSDVNKIDRWRDPPAEKKIRLVDAKNPVLAKIHEIRELHTSESDRSCLHAELDTEKFLNYQPGDHLGVYAENDETEVHRLASKVDGGDLDRIISVYSIDDVNARSPIVGPCTLKAALKQYYDITSPARKILCAIMAQYAQDEAEKKRLVLLASDDPDEQKEYIKWIVEDLRTPYEVLKEFPSVKVPLEHFLEGLVKMQPRYYSISSSPNVFPGRVHITAVLVDYFTPTKRRARGVVTGWLAARKADLANNITPRLPAFIRRSNFKLPMQLAAPVIMVGPGTGLAPFRGFIQERKHKISLNKDGKPVGESILFFGCRDPSKDYIYRNELESSVKDGALTTLSVAFSRTQADKEYVQHKMQQGDFPQRIWKILSSGGYFYICGDARNMARDVQAVLVEIICKEGGKSAKEAEEFIKKLQSGSAPHYLSDVWS